MSVLNQSGEEQVECPLCMEPLEVDDLNFYPCTCGYQICRFCWHRIRTDENGLCPACRKAYSEDPADFIPLSKEQVAKLKADKRHRDQQRKAKLSENRKHLASVRVVQRNLVFVVGLPVRLADPELLKKHEYFGKFGKIHKVVINQSTSYAGSQGPSASAYVTYMKSDDALRAIQSVNNITIDGRLLKSSLGTTKYCSHFMKNQPCPKADCMYLHDFGDPEASFTKEQMHAGKHQEYEKKLHEALLSRQNTTPPPVCGAVAEPKSSTTPPAGHTQQEAVGGAATQPVKKEGSKTTTTTKEGTPPGGNTNKENNSWPHLDKNEKPEKPAKDRSKSNNNNNKSKSRNTHNPSGIGTIQILNNKVNNNSSICNSNVNNERSSTSSSLSSSSSDNVYYMNSHLENGPSANANTSATTTALKTDAKAVKRDRDIDNNDKENKIIVDSGDTHTQTRRSSSSSNSKNNSIIVNYAENSELFENIDVVEDKGGDKDGVARISDSGLNRYKKSDLGSSSSRRMMEVQSIFGLAETGVGNNAHSFFSEGFQTVSSIEGAGDHHHHHHHRHHHIVNRHHHHHHQRKDEDEADLNMATPTSGVLLTDSFPAINTTEDWAAAFGFSSHLTGRGGSAPSPSRSSPDDPSSPLASNKEGVATATAAPSGAFRRANLGGVFSATADDGGKSLLSEGSGGSFDVARRYFEGDKQQESILDALVMSNIGNGGKMNGLVGSQQQQQHFGGLVNNKEQSLLNSNNSNSGNNGLLNGLDQNMSKFFMDFHKNQSQMNMLNGLNSMLSPQQQQNGFYQQHQQQQSAAQERFLLLQQQKQLEEQLMNLNMKQQQQRLLQNYQFQQQQQQNGFANGQSAFARHHLYAGPQGAGPGPQPNVAATPTTTPPVAPASTAKARPQQRAEDELDFDPFQETQKALAEMMATEKSCGGHLHAPQQGRTNLAAQSGRVNNGLLLHNGGGQSSTSGGGGGQLPPPPPGFIQPNNTHMNSFDITTNMNDWKNLDPAILSSSRHFQLANNHHHHHHQQQQRDHAPYHQTQPQQPQQMSNSQTSPVAQAQNRASFAPVDFQVGGGATPGGVFSNFAHQNLNGFHGNQQQQQPQQQQQNWFATGDNFSGTNMAGPPGFRNSQQTKQQEC